MARASVDTFGLLNLWPEYMAEDEWRFNQMLGDGVRLSPGDGNPVYIQPEREYIARELRNAVIKASQWLGCWPAPTWIVNESVVLNSDLRWDCQTLDAKYGRLIEFGTRASTLIDDDVQPAYTDEGGGVVDTATITVTTAHTADEIQVFFRTDDGAKSAGSNLWRIEPLTVTKVGNQATITGPAWLFVSPREVWSRGYETDVMTNKFAGDTGDPAVNLVPLVDIYRVYTDATDAVQLKLPASIDPDPVSVTAEITNAHLGKFRLYTGDDQLEPTGKPLSVTISYRAGVPLDENGRMESVYAEALVRYANTLMAQVPPITARAQAMWQQDVTVVAASAFEAWYPPPFAQTVGGQYAWSAVKDLRIASKGREVNHR